MNEDYTAGVLKGIPIFCINRKYTSYPSTPMLKEVYLFKFDNNFGANVIGFKNKELFNGLNYEMTVFEFGDDNFPITRNTAIPNRLLQGDAMYIHLLLTEIESLSRRT